MGNLTDFGAIRIRRKKTAWESVHYKYDIYFLVCCWNEQTDFPNRVHKFAGKISFLQETTSAGSLYFDGNLACIIHSIYNDQAA